MAFIPVTTVAIGLCLIPFSLDEIVLFFYQMLNIIHTAVAIFSSVTVKQFLCNLRELSKYL